jgi:hypothetical protein
MNLQVHAHVTTYALHSRAFNYEYHYVGTMAGIEGKARRYK